MVTPTPRAHADDGTPPRMPRWVKVSALVVGLLVLLFVILRLTGVGGEHGPGRHVSGATAPLVGTPGLGHPPAAMTLG